MSGPPVVISGAYVTAGKIKKQVRFYELVLLDQHDQVVDIEPGFFNDLWKMLPELDPKDRLATHFATRYAGEWKLAKSPAQDYVKFGRVHNRSDWPVTFDEDAVSFGELSVGGDDGARLGLAESAYLVAVPGINVLAILSVGRAVSISGLEAWFMQVTNNVRTSMTLQLLPVVDQQTASKLDRAKGVKKINIRVPRGMASDYEDEGEVGRALAEATAVTTGEMDVEITWSVGRGSASPGTYAKLLRELRRVVGGRGSVDKIRANLLLPTEDGGETSEPVDFIKQRVAYPVALDVDHASAFSEQSALSGIIRAIDRFRDEVMD